MSARLLLLLLAAGYLTGTPQPVCAQVPLPLEKELAVPGSALSEIDEDLLELKAPETGGTSDRAKRASAAAAYASGLHLERQGRFEDALQRLRQAAGDDPGYVPIQARVGLVLVKLKQPREALQWTEGALKRHPTSGELMALLAVIHGELRNLPEAERWAGLSLEANPHLIANYVTLAQMAVNRGETARVRVLFEQSKKTQSTQAAWYARLASIWIELLPSDGKTLPSQAAREVAPFLEKAAALDPENLLLTLSLGQAAFMGGDYTSALAYFEKVEKKRPDLPAVRQRLAECALRLGLHEQAIGHLERLLEQNSTRTQLLPVIAELHGKLDQWPQAAEHYRQALLFAPNDPKITFSLAESQMKAGDYPAALATLSGATIQFPRLFAFPYLQGIVHFLDGNAKASYEAYTRAEALALAGSDGLPDRLFYYRLAMAAEKAGEIAAMESALRRCIKVDPKDHEALNFLGYYFAEKNIRLDEAEALVMRAVEIQPGNGAYLDSLGWVYYQQGRYARARAYLARAVEKMPDDPVVLEHLGDVWIKLGNRYKAVECWKKALEKATEPDSLQQKIREHS